MKLKTLANQLGLKFTGCQDAELTTCAPLTTTASDALSFFDNPKYKNELSSTKASAVILKAEFAELLPKTTAAIISQTPYTHWAQALALLHPNDAAPTIHPTAVIEEGAKLGKNISIGANSFISADSVIGDDTTIHANTTIQHATIGAQCIIHPNVSIGQDGFGFAPDAANQTILKVPQIGRVTIGNQVEIGAGSTIDRGALEETKIGHLCKLDNLVQIAHNVQLGNGVIIASQSGVSGSTKVGNGVIIGGQVGIAGHISIADGITIAAKSGVTKSLTKAGETYGGLPAVPVKEWRKKEAAISRLSKSK